MGPLGAMRAACSCCSTCCARTPPSGLACLIKVTLGRLLGSSNHQTEMCSCLVGALSPCGLRHIIHTAIVLLATCSK